MTTRPDMATTIKRAAGRSEAQRFIPENDPLSSGGLSAAASANAWSIANGLLAALLAQAAGVAFDREDHE